MQGHNRRMLRMELPGSTPQGGSGWNERVGQVGGCVRRRGRELDGGR